VLFVIKHFTKYTLCFHTHTPHHTKSALGSRGVTHVYVLSLGDITGSQKNNMAPDWATLTIIYSQCDWRRRIASLVVD